MTGSRLRMRAPNRIIYGRELTQHPHSHREMRDFNDEVAELFADYPQDVKKAVFAIFNKTDIQKRWVPVRLPNGIPGTTVETVEQFSSPNAAAALIKLLAGGGELESVGIYSNKYNKCLMIFFDYGAKPVSFKPSSWHQQLSPSDNNSATSTTTPNPTPNPLRQRFNDKTFKIAFATLAETMEGVPVEPGCMRRNAKILFETIQTLIDQGHLDKAVMFAPPKAKGDGDALVATALTLRNDPQSLLALVVSVIREEIVEYRNKDAAEIGCSAYDKLVTLAAADGAENIDFTQHLHANMSLAPITTNLILALLPSDKRVKTMRKTTENEPYAARRNESFVQRMALQMLMVLQILTHNTKGAKGRSPLSYFNPIAIFIGLVLKIGACAESVSSIFSSSGLACTPMFARSVFSVVEANVRAALAGVKDTLGGFDDNGLCLFVYGDNWVPNREHKGSLNNLSNGGIVEYIQTITLMMWVPYALIKVYIKLQKKGKPERALPEEYHLGQSNCNYPLLREVVKNQPWWGNLEKKGKSNMHDVKKTCGFNSALIEQGRHEGPIARLRDFFGLPSVGGNFGTFRDWISTLKATIDTYVGLRRYVVVVGDQEGDQAHNLWLSDRHYAGDDEYQKRVGFFPCNFHLQKNFIETIRSAMYYRPLQSFLLYNIFQEKTMLEAHKEYFVDPLKTEQETLKREQKKAAKEAATLEKDRKKKEKEKEDRKKKKKKEEKEKLAHEVAKKKKGEQKKVFAEEVKKRSEMANSHQHNTRVKNIFQKCMDVLANEAGRGEEEEEEEEEVIDLSGNDDVDDDGEEPAAGESESTEEIEKLLIELENLMKKAEGDVSVQLRMTTEDIDEYDEKLYKVEQLIHRASINDSELLTKIQCRKDVLDAFHERIKKLDNYPKNEFGYSTTDCNKVKCSYARARHQYVILWLAYDCIRKDLIIYLREKLGLSDDVEEAEVIDRAIKHPVWGVRFRHVYEFFETDLRLALLPFKEWDKGDMIGVLTASFWYMATFGAFGRKKLMISVANFLEQFLRWQRDAPRFITWLSLNTRWLTNYFIECRNGVISNVFKYGKKSTLSVETIARESTLVQFYSRVRARIRLLLGKGERVVNTLETLDIWKLNSEKEKNYFEGAKKCEMELFKGAVEGSTGHTYKWMDRMDWFQTDMDKDLYDKFELYSGRTRLNKMKLDKVKDEWEDGGGEDIEGTGKDGKILKWDYVNACLKRNMKNVEEGCEQLRKELHGNGDDDEDMGGVEEE